MIINKSVIEETSSVIETPDPTTIEFQEVFERVLEQVLSSKERRLVLVVDNLDRLSTQEAESVWSLLRSFIDNPGYSNKDWLRKVWVIVPVAVTASQESTMDFLTPTGASSRKSESQFLEKVFQVGFTLPPPVLSNWREFLFDLLDKAFTGFDGREFEMIVRLYDLHLRRDNLQIEPEPTPRSMTLFVNDVVALWVQWEDQFALSHLAAFSLAARDANLISKLQLRKEPTDAIGRLLNATDLVREFAAILFNVDSLDKAYVMLLGPAIVDALKNGKSDVIAIHAPAGKPFYEVLDSVLTNWLSVWAHGDIAGYCSALVTLHAVFKPSELKEVLKRDDKQREAVELPTTVTANLTRLALEGVRNFGPLPLGSEAIRPAMESLLDLCPSQNVPQAIAASIRQLSSITSMEFDKISNDDALFRRWLNDLASLTGNPKIRVQLFPDEEIVNAIKLSISMPSWIKFCAHFFQNNKAMLHWFRPEGAQRDLAKTILEALAQNRYTWGEFAAMAREIELQDSVDEKKEVARQFAEVAAAVVSQLRQTGTQALLTGHCLVWTLHWMKRFDSAFRDALHQAVEDGMAHNVLANLHGSSVASATCLLAILSVRADGQLSNQFADSASGIQILKDILEKPELKMEVVREFVPLLRELEEYRLLVDVVIKNASSVSFVRKILAEFNDSDHAALNECFNLIASPDEIDLFFDRVGESEEAAQKLKSSVVDYHFRRRNLVKALLEHPLKAEMSRLYGFVILVGGSESSEFITAINELLNQLDKAAWLSSILETNGPVLLLIDMRKAGLTPSIGSSARAALMVNAQSLLDEPSMGLSAATVAAIELMLNALPSIERRGFAEDLYEAVTKKKALTNELFWKCYGSVIEEGMVALGKQCQFARRIIKPSIELLDYQTLTWALPVLQRLPSDQKEIGSPAAHDVIQACRKELEKQEQPTEHAGLLSSIVETFEGSI